LSKICPTCGQLLPATLVDVPKRIPKASRAATLPFDRPVLDRRDAILAAVWVLLQPSVGRAVLVTDWRAQNRKAALAMARAGILPAAAAAAWEQASSRKGEPIVLLAIVHREIEQAYCRRAGKAAQA
jgi:hypothetical protein